MSSHKLETMSSARSVRNEATNFLNTFSPAQIQYGTIFSSSNMDHSLDESGLNDLAHMDKRSAHNALERQRRETLNTKFQQLAHALPSLQSVRRPSKTVIVAKSLEFVNLSIDQETKFKKKIDYLRQENDRLRDEALLRAKQQGRKISIKTTKGTAAVTSSTPTSCSISFVNPLDLTPNKPVMKIEQIKEETKATSPTSISQNPSSSADITTPDASATTTPAKSNLSTSACISKKLPSSTSLDSAHTSSTASSTPSANTSVKRRKSGHENSIVSTKKRSRRPTPSPATTIATVDGFSNDNINNSLFTGYASSTSMAHLPPGAHALVLPDQELYQQGLASPFVNHHPTIGSCYYPPPYPTPALMTPQQSPLTPVPHHYPHHQHISTAAAQPQPPSAVAAAAAMAAATTSTATTAIATGAMGAQQQHHLVAPFPTTMLINDDGAMIPPFQSSVLDMTTYNTPTATASPASYIPNSVYHPVIYPPPYPQPDQSAMDYPW